MSAMRGERYAVYWTPDPVHPLWRAGCDWLGRDPEAALDLASPPVGAQRAAAARYGFHATLKAPFRLAAGTAPEQLFDAVGELAARRADFQMPPLQVDWLDDFLALRPAGPLPAHHALRRLADDCVAALDGLRAPATPAERTRHAATLDGDAERLSLLARWGYPHVFEAWRFHMTLGDRFAERSGDAARAFESEACRHFAASLDVPLRCSALSVFHEPGVGQAFRLIRRLPLASGESPR